jgi:hypothetical protein
MAGTENKLIAWPTATKNAYASLARKRRVSVNALINKALREWMEAERLIESEQRWTAKGRAK